MTDTKHPHRDPAPIPDEPWLGERRPMPSWAVAAVLLGAAAIIVAAGRAADRAAQAYDDAEPCARYVTGKVTVTDDQGRLALVDHTWCAEWKPGREPRRKAVTSES